MKKIMRWVVVVLVVAAVGVGGYWYYLNKRVSASTTTGGTTYTQVVQVTQGSLDATVSIVGELEAEQSASLAFEQMSGTANLLTLAVQAGNVVTQGQVLATIDTASYQQALDQAKSDLLAAEETLADLKTPATALQIAQADVAVSKAKVGLQKAQDALDELVNPDITSLESAAASAKSALAKAQANVLAQEQDTAAVTQLNKLIYAESTPTAEYNKGATYEARQAETELDHRRRVVWRLSGGLVVRPDGPGGAPVAGDHGGRVGRVSPGSALELGGSGNGPALRAGKQPIPPVLRGRRWSGSRVRDHRPDRPGHLDLVRSGAGRLCDLAERPRAGLRCDAGPGGCQDRSALALDHQHGPPAHLPGAGTSSTGGRGTAGAGCSPNRQA